MDFYQHRLSQSLSSQSLVNSVSSGSFTSKQDRIDDGYIDQTPEPITYSLGGDETNENINKSSKYSSENSLSRISTKVLPPNFLNFDDLYHGEEEFYISKEWRQWFSFNAEADGFRFNNYDKVLEYLKQSQNDNLDDFHFSLHEIFSDVNPWILDEKLNQIKNLSINSKKDLHLLVECIYYKCLATRDINGHFDTMTTLCCELFDEIGIFDETISNVVMFGELLSAKCRQSFFIQDISVAHHYLRNVKLISKLCKTNTFDRRIIIVCLYFLCQSQKQAHLEAFFQILKQWFGIPSLFELADSSVKNKNAINFVFDELENFISTIEKQRKEFFDTKDAKNSSIEFDDQTPRSPDTPEISKYTFEQLKKSLEDYDHIFNNRK